MRNDIEHDLRELLERKARDAWTAPRPPESVIRRGRRRQLGTALVTGATVIAVIAGSVAGLGAIRREADGLVPANDPWAGYEVFQRTAAVHAFTITSSSDWYLVNQWRWARPIAADEPLEDRVTPVLMLSNEDRGLTTSPCFDRTTSLGMTEAVMTIAFDDGYHFAHQGQPDALPQAPVRFEVGETDSRGSCGAGTYVRFATEDLPYVAHFMFGEDVPDEERAALIGSFESMTAQALLDPTPIGSRQDHPTGAYVIAGGENAAGPWTLELSPSDRDIRLTVRQSGEGSDRSMFDITPFPVPAVEPISASVGDPTFGVVSLEAAAVDVVPVDGSPSVRGTIVPLPSSLAFGFDLFFASYEADVPAVPRALDAAGDPLPFPDGPFPTVVPIADPIRRATVVIGSTTLGVDWLATFSGRFEDGSACLHVRIRGSLLDGINPLCPPRPRQLFARQAPSVHSWIGRNLAVHAGSVPAEVKAIRFVGNDGSVPAHFAQCVDGPLGWEEVRVCAIALPPEGSGVLLYTDRDGSVLYRDGAISWGPIKASTGP